MGRLAVPQLEVEWTPFVPLVIALAFPSALQAYHCFFETFLRFCCTTFVVYDLLDQYRCALLRARPLLVCPTLPLTFNI